MKLKDALKRIEELERKVKELEARPLVEQHNHYHYPQPLYSQPCLPTYPWGAPVIWGGVGHNVGAVSEPNYSTMQWTDGLGNTGTYKVGN